MGTTLGKRFSDSTSRAEVFRLILAAACFTCLTSAQCTQAGHVDLGEWRKESGFCPSHVTSQIDCFFRANEVGITSNVRYEEETTYPRGCYLSRDTSQVWFNAGPSTVPCSARYQCICADSCDPCDAGKYLNHPNDEKCSSCPAGMSSAAAATACTACEAGKFAAASGSSTCKTCAIGSFTTGTTACSECPSGSACNGSGAKEACPPGSTSEAASSSCSLCPAGFECPGGTAKVACPCGHFSGVGMAKCRIHCPDGSFGVTSSGAAICAPCPRGSRCFNGYKFACPAGSFQDEAEQTECKPCFPAYYGGTTNQISGECSGPCPADFFCPSGTKDPIKCPDGTYCAAGVAIPAVRLACLPGTFEFDPSDPSPTRCHICPDKTFANTTNQAQCTPCTSLSCPGNGPRKGCGGASAGYCSSCSPGTFLSGSTCEPCAPGNYSRSENAVRCEACPPKTYQPDFGKGFCLPHSVCPQGEFVISRANATADRSCQQCPRMHFSATSNAANCTRCPPGKFQDKRGQPYCETKQPCAPGTFEANVTDTSSTRCLACPPGRISTTSNALECIDCAIGQHTNSTNRIACMPCAPGHFGGSKPRDSVQHCQRCLPGRFQPAQAQKDCLKCRESYACPQNSTFEQSCRGNEFVVREEQTCRPCPRIGPEAEAECKSGQLLLKDGFFSSATLRSGAVPRIGTTAINSRTVFTKCPCEKCCSVNNYTGATQCRFGTSGTLCAICQKAPERFHRQVSGVCVPCPQVNLRAFIRAESAQIATFVLLALLVLLLAAMDVRAQWKHWRWLQLRLQGLQKRFAWKLKILVNFLQFVTLAGVVYTIKWPPLFADFLRVLPMLDVFRFFPLDCAFDFDADAALYASTLTFVALAALAALAQRAKRLGALSYFAAKADALTKSVLVLIYAIYPPLAANIFATFNCGTVVHSDGATRFLRADYSIECDSPSHQAAEVYAGVCIVCICIGTPLVYLGLLWRNREALQSGARSARHLLFLVEEYRPGCWYWESVETTKKLFLTGFAVFIAPGTVLQLALALGLTLTHGLLLGRLKPYVHQHDNRLGDLLNILTALMLFIAILLETDTMGAQLEGAMSDPGLAFRLLGYDRDALAVALVTLVCVGFAVFGWLVRADIIAAQHDERMRYSDGSLVWFPKSKNHHVFLSHSKQDAGDQIAHIKKELETHCSTIEIFTDGTAGRKELGLGTKGSFEDIVGSTGLMVCFISKTYFTQKRCILELKTALESGTNVAFVMETEPRYGRTSNKEVMEHALGQLQRAAQDAAAKASNVVNTYTDRLSPEHCAAERAVAAALVAFGAARSGSAAKFEEARRVLASAKVARDKAAAHAKGVMDEQSGTPPDWMTTEGEILAEFLQALLPTMLDDKQPNARPVIPWYRDEHNRKYSLKRMAQEVLVSTFDTSHFDRVDCDSKGLPVLHIAGETSHLRVHMPPPAQYGNDGGDRSWQPCDAHLYLSPHHPASMVLQQKLQHRLPGIICSTKDLSRCSHILMVLDAGRCGDAQADSPALNNEAYRNDLLEAARLGVPPVLLHVGSAPFDTYMWGKGTALWKAGLFNDMAVPCPEAALQPANAAGPTQFHELESIALGRVGLEMKQCAGGVQRGRPRVQVPRALRKFIDALATHVNRPRAKERAVGMRTLQAPAPGFRPAGIKATMSNPMLDLDGQDGLQAKEGGAHAGAHRSSVQRQDSAHDTGWSAFPDSCTAFDSHNPVRTGARTSADGTPMKRGEISDPSYRVKSDSTIARTARTSSRGMAVL